MERVLPARHCVATVTDREYLPGTAILFSSFLRHNPWFDGDLVVLHDGLRTRHRRRLRHLPGLRFVRVGEELRLRLDALAEKHPDLRPRLARFLSLEAFALPGYRWILYLDSDVLCTGDVRGILNHPGADEAGREDSTDSPAPPLVACPDQTGFRNQVRDPESFVPLSRGTVANSREVLADAFNTGVMLIRPHRLEPGLAHRLLEYLHPDRWSAVRTGHTDQAVLNHHFGGRCRKASETYNYLLATDSDRWDRAPMSDAALLHFLGRPKPWQVLWTVPPEGAGDQQRRGWRVWQAEARREALARLTGAGHPGPLMRLVAAACRRLAVRGWRALTNRWG